MDNLEFLSLKISLQQYDSIFYKIVEHGMPIACETIPTAAVCFDQFGKVLNFKINPKFWEELSFEQKQFVLSHECLHVILNFSARMQNISKDFDQYNMTLFNVAQDIVINHMLISMFGFDRNVIDPEKKYCWLDTVFENDTSIEENREAEYYFNKLKEKNPPPESLPILVDSHGLGGDGVKNDDNLNEGETEDFKDFYPIIADDLNPEEIDKLGSIENSNMSSQDLGGKQAGSSPGMGSFVANTKKTKKKKKWETIIKKWTNFKRKETQKQIDQWVFKDRRMNLLPSDYMLPSSKKLDLLAKEKNKIDVLFFLDTSGSCVSYAQRFFDAAKSIPTDIFNIELFCFDTRVYPTSLKTGKLYGFGGTSFSCIDRYVNKHYINNPKNKHKGKKTFVWVLTDGYGDDIDPKYPKNWFWFLTPYNSTCCIPSQSKTFKLSNYE